MSLILIVVYEYTCPRSLWYASAPKYANVYEYGILNFMIDILGIGTDISVIERFRTARFLERVASYFMSPTEWQMIQGSADLPRSLASRFAIKEAVIKAVPIRVSPLDFEIIQRAEKPTVSWIKGNIPYQVLVSTSHDGSYAQASALCMRI